MHRPAQKRIVVGNVPDFWDRLAASASRFLGLDYDGTLAPFHVDPLQARPLPGVVELLEAILRDPHTTLAVISGRPVAEVLRLLGNLPATIIGSHGFELRREGYDGWDIRKPTADQQAGLAKAGEAAVNGGYGHKLEQKVASLALHTRGLPAGKASLMEEEALAWWTPIASLHNLECRRFNGGVEIRCRGWHKGSALTDLLQRQAEGVFAVYVGDDETDEDAFRAVQEKGVGIRVGPPSLSTAAQGVLEDCRAVRDFLEAWRSVTHLDGR